MTFQGFVSGSDAECGNLDFLCARTCAISGYSVTESSGRFSITPRFSSPPGMSGCYCASCAGQSAGGSGVGTCNDDHGSTFDAVLFGNTVTTLTTSHGIRCYARFTGSGSILGKTLPSPTQANRPPSQCNACKPRPHPHITRSILGRKQAP